jgi:hypothetical protein
MLLAENLNKDIGKEPSFCVLYQSSDFSIGYPYEYSTLRSMPFYFFFGSATVKNIPP